MWQRLGTSRACATEAKFKRLKSSVVTHDYQSGDSVVIARVFIYCDQNNL